MRNTFGEIRLPGLVAILGLLALLIGLIIIIALPNLKLAAWGILLLGVILLGAAFIMDYQRVGRAISGRRGRFGTATTVTVSIFIGIILLANAISFGNFYRFDLTGVSQFTLTSQTKDVLSKLKIPIKVTCFFTPDDPYGGVNSYVTNLLTQYQNYTDQLSVKIIDPDEHPDQARQYDIQVYSTVVFESEKGLRLVLPQEIVVVSGQQITGIEAEHAFTSAILEITGIVQKKVYFLTGHGESGINSEYSNVRDSLRDNLYQVETLDLLQTHAIPGDMAALVIAAPLRALNAEEATIIQQYMQNGGRVLFLLNPDSPPEFKQLLAPWGVDVEGGTVIDPSSYAAPNKDNLLIPRTRNFLQLSNVYFPGATAIIPQPEYQSSQIAGTTEFVWISENTSIELYSLLRASANSWLEKNFNPDEEPQFNEGADLGPPLHIGFLITNSTSQPGATPVEGEGTRLIVLGDSDFASDQNFYNGNNGELFLNSVNILSAGTELISIKRQVLPFRRLVVGPEATTFMQYSSIILLPLLVLLTGGVMWWRRR